MNPETEIRKLNRTLTLVNLAVLMTIITLGITTVVSKNRMTDLTEKTAEIAQKAGVEFQTETNSVFGIRSVRLK